MMKGESDGRFGDVFSAGLEQFLFVFAQLVMKKRLWKK